MICWCGLNFVVLDGECAQRNSEMMAFSITQFGIIALNVLSVSSKSDVSAPVVTWVSTPVQPGQVLLIQGCCFNNATAVSIVAAGGQQARLIPEQVSMNSLKVVVPTTFPNGSVYNISIVASDVGVSSDATFVNVPDAWWVQGDQGDTASPGGWLRVIGNCLSLPRGVVNDQHITSENVDSLWSAAQAAAQSRNFSALIESQIRLSRIVGDGSADRNVHARTTPSIRLTPVHSNANATPQMKGNVAEPIIISAATENVTLTSAHFLLPSSLTSGEWQVEITNGASGANYVTLDSFVSPAAPHVSTIIVQQPRSVPLEVFNVSDYGNHSLPCNLRDRSGACRTADGAVQAALAAAKANNGGTVYFESGTFYLSQPLEVSPNVILKVCR